MFSIDKAKFFVPFLYFIRTRIASPAKLFSWGIIYIIPTAYIAYHFYNETISFGIFLFSFVLQAVAIYNFYEIGYIENDTETIKNEQNPTLRLKQQDFVFYEKYKWIIYGSRVITGILVFAVLHMAKPDFAGYWQFVIAVAMLLPIYLIYNRVRNKFTLLLHFILVTIRFASYPLLYVILNETAVKQILPVLFVFPVINVMERAALKRFNIRQLSFILATSTSIDKFRMIYYCLFTAIFLAIYAGTAQFGWLTILFAYFALYRSVIVVKQNFKTS